MAYSVELVERDFDGRVEKQIVVFNGDEVDFSLDLDEADNLVDQIIYAIEDSGWYYEGVGADDIPGLEFTE